MRLWAFTCLGLVLAAASPAGDSFQTGDWQGRANFNGEGTFTDCTVLMPDPEHTTVGFVMTHGNDFGMIVADPALKLEPGGQKPTLIHVEGIDSVAAIADVVADNGVLIPLENGGALALAIGEGKEFRVNIREKEFVLQRPRTGEALKALKACVESHRGKNRVEL
ncbi:hypothetical protein [Methyloceanibacter caenitepidi]|uniref:Uncharacterized protein n=1 Tax=Methyloceanibacter caenitepidi TaxID=1384459 RepID=A0A0A8K1P0_9HYPH|nr:hypothetical protein [Methyloceanibacter caenitepidi]BAQ16422.1 hypothetical protein GL4_0962 [Methyloceanibacter caenitepidi]